MRVVFTEAFLKDRKELPLIIQRKFEKQLSFLLEDIRYPSLQAKKYDAVNDIWQGRVNSTYRFYWKIQGDAYKILTIKKHPQ